MAQRKSLKDRLNEENDFQPTTINGKKNGKGLKTLIEDSPAEEPKDNIDTPDVKKVKLTLNLTETEHLIFQNCCKLDKVSMQDKLRELALEYARENQKRLLSIQI